MIVSRYELIWAGLAVMVGAEPDRARVVGRAGDDGFFDDHDVALYDLAELAHDDGGHVLQRLLSSGTPVVGLARDGDGTADDGVELLGLRDLVREDMSGPDLLEVLEKAAGAGRRFRTSRGQPVALSGRELEVLGLVAAGLTNPEIAERLYVSINTVKTYIRTGYQKIGVTRRPDAVLWAVTHGIASRVGEGDPWRRAGIESPADVIV